MAAEDKDRREKFALSIYTAMLANPHIFFRSDGQGEVHDYSIEGPPPQVAVAMAEGLMDSLDTAEMVSKVHVEMDTSVAKA